MYTAGHLEILRDALKMYEKIHGSPYFSKDSQDEKDEKVLMASISFPDFPCGKVEVVGDRLVNKMHACNVVRLIANMLFDELSLGYQSHNGFYSLWHAMSHDPDKSVSNIARNVAEYILICCKLAHEERSFFWLGFALHIVMDSYSPAHVLRQSSLKLGPDVERDVVTYLKMHDSELPEKEQRNVRDMRRLIADVAADVAAGRKYSDIVDEQAKHDRKMRNRVAFVIFDHVQRESFKAEFGSITRRYMRSKKTSKTSKSSKTSKTSKTSTTSKIRSTQAVLRGFGGATPIATPTIMNFYYYPLQRGLFHRVHDRLAAVREAGLYPSVVHDVYKILALFKSSSRSKVRFITRVSDLLRDRTLAVHAECGDVETGFDISRLLYPVYRTQDFKKEKLGTYVSEVGTIKRLGPRTFALPVGPSGSDMTF